MYKSLICLLLVCISFNAGAEIKTKSLAKKKWKTVESQNFRIITDVSAKKARIIAEQLEKYRAFNVMFLNIKPKLPSAKLRLFITDSRATWKALGLPKEYVSVFTSSTNISPPTIFVDVKGFFGSSFRKANSGRATVLNAVSSKLFNDVGLNESFPPWFRTGFAYYLATYTEPRDEIMLGSVAAYEQRLYSVLNYGGGVSSFDTQALFSKVKQPERRPAQSKDSWFKTVNKYYMQSFLTIHYFYSNNERRRKMVEYLKLIHAGQGFETSFATAFAMSFDGFDSELRKYASGKRLTARAFNRAEIEKLLDLPTDYTLTDTAPEEFFKLFMPSLNRLGESTISNQDKQKFIKELKAKYGEVLFPNREAEAL